MESVYPEFNQVQKYKLLADTGKEDTNINFQMLIFHTRIFPLPVKMPGNAKNQQQQ